MIDLSLNHSHKPEDQVDHLNHQAWDLRDINREQAISLAQEARSIAETLGYPQGWAGVQIVLGFVDYRMEQYADALEKANQAQDILSLSANKWLGRAFFVKAAAYLQLGDRSLAEEYYRRQLEQGKQLGDLELEALAINGLGIHATYDDLELGRKHFEQALEIFYRLDNPEGQATVLYNLAFLDYTLGNNQQAKERALKSFGVRKGMHLEMHEIGTLGLLGLITASQGQADAALNFINQALEIANVQLPELVPMCLLRIGRVSMTAKLHSKALPVLQQALKLCETTGNLRRIVGCHQALVECYTAMGEPERAQQHQRRFEELSERIRKH